MINTFNLEGSQLHIQRSFVCMYISATFTLCVHLRMHVPFDFSFCIHSDKEKDNICPIWSLLGLLWLFIFFFCIHSKAGSIRFGQLASVNDKPQHVHHTL